MAEELEKQNGIPVPEEGSEEWLKLNKMARVSVPLVLVIFTLGVFMQQAFNMIYVNIGDQLGQSGLAPLITSIPGIVLGIGRAVGEAMATATVSSTICGRGKSESASTISAGTSRSFRNET